MDLAEIKATLTAAMNHMWELNKYATACRSMLEHVQWREVETGPGAVDFACPWCEAFKDDGHKPDCELAALLK